MDFHPRRWTVGGVDSDTPVCFIGDKSQFGRSAIMLFSDDQRSTLEWVMEQADARRELAMVRDSRRRWTDHWLTRAGAVVGVAGLFMNLVLNIVLLARGQR